MAISRLIHCGSHDPWLSVYKSAWLSPAIEEELLSRLSCKREIGNAHDTHAVAVRNIIDGDIKTVGRFPRKISALDMRGSIFSY